MAECQCALFLVRCFQTRSAEGRIPLCHFLVRCFETEENAYAAREAAGVRTGQRALGPGQRPSSSQEDETAAREAVRGLLPIGYSRLR